jgi:hypothetical protein
MHIRSLSDPGCVADECTHEMRPPSPVTSFCPERSDPIEGMPLEDQIGGDDASFTAEAMLLEFVGPWVERHRSPEHSTDRTEAQSVVSDLNTSQFTQEWLDAQPGIPASHLEQLDRPMYIHAPALYSESSDCTISDRSSQRTISVTSSQRAVSDHTTDRTVSEDWAAERNQNRMAHHNNEDTGSSTEEMESD